MLKSTHRPAPKPGAPPSLPPGWTAHTAPTGHQYYYNAATKQSTYTHPSAALYPPPAQLPFHGPPPLQRHPAQPYAAPPPNAFPQHNPPVAGFVGHGAFPPAFAPPPFGFQDPARGRGHLTGSNTVSIGGRGGGGGGGLGGPGAGLGGSAYIPRFQPGGGGRRRPPPLHERDRPKSKHALAGCEPWLLVRTKLGRRFVHNPAKGESFWRVPDFLKDKVAALEAQLEQQTKEKEKEKEQKSLLAAAAGGPAAATTTTSTAGQQPSPAASGATSMQRPGHASARDDGDGEHRDGPQGRDEEDADEDDQDAEGVDSTDYEDDDDDDDDDAETPYKRPRRGSGAAVREFGEDDIAYQLAAMGEQYGLDPGEYGLAPAEDGDEGGEGGGGGGSGEAWPDGAAGLPLTDEECTGLFKEMLDEHALNPYATWDKIVAEGRLVDDARYTALPNMKARREVWAEWSREKIHVLKEQRAKTEAKNPLIVYLAFLEKHASLKLYWPEFRRKHKAAPEMRDPKLTDKQREKWYRDFVNRLKLPESTLNRDLAALLREQPPSALKGATTGTADAASDAASDPAALPLLLLAQLPPAVLTDLRYLSPRPAKRDALVAAYISTLGDARQPGDDAGGGTTGGGTTGERGTGGGTGGGRGTGGGGEGQERGDARRQQQQQQEEALAARAAAIAAQRQRAEQARRAGLRALRDEEAEVARALRVGKDGLRRQLAPQTTAAAGSGGGGGGGGGGEDEGGSGGDGSTTAAAAAAAASGSAT